MVRHRQEEEVEGVRLAAAGGQALFEGSDGLGVLPRAKLGDAQRVEVNSQARRQLDGAAGQRQCATGGAGRFGTRGQLPGSVVAAHRQPFSDGGLVRLQRQRGLQVGDRGLVVFEESVDPSPSGPQMRVIRLQADRLREVGDRVL